MNFTAGGMTRSKTTVRSAYASFLDRLDKDDDGGNFTAADERNEVIRISTSFYDKEAPRPGKHGTLENTESVEKMARQVDPGSLLQTFEFYAALFAPHQQLIKKVPTYSEIKFANNTLSQGELMCFCNDFALTPNIVSRQDIRHVWPFIQEEHSGYAGGSSEKRIGKELSLEGFKQFLCRIALVNMVSPEGRPVHLSKKRQAHEAVGNLVKYLKFDNKKYIKKKLRTTGAATQTRLSGAMKAPCKNPYIKHDAKRFKMVYPPPKGDNSINGIIEAAKKKREALRAGATGNGNARTLDSSVYRKAMDSYIPSLKNIFKPFEAELVLNEWAPFVRDRASGQICRCYIDAGEVIRGHLYKYKVTLVNQSSRKVKFQRPFLEPEDADNNIRIDATFDPQVVKPGRATHAIVSLVAPHHYEANASIVFAAHAVDGPSNLRENKTINKAMVRCPLYVISFGAHHGEQNKPRQAMTLRERMTTYLPEPDENGGVVPPATAPPSDSEGEEVEEDAQEETEEEYAFRKKQEMKAKLRGPYVQDLERKTAELWGEINKWKHAKSANNALAHEVGKKNVRDLMALSLVGRPRGTMPVVPALDQILKMEFLSPSPSFAEPRKTPKWMVNGEMSAPQEFDEHGSVIQKPRVVDALMKNKRRKAMAHRRRRKKLPFLPAVTAYSSVDFRKDGDVYRAIHGKSLIGSTSSLHSLTLPNTEHYTIRRSATADVLRDRRERVAMVRSKSAAGKMLLKKIA